MTSHRILVVAPFPPRLAATHGGARVVGRLALELARTNEVALLCLHAAGEPAVDSALAGRLAFVEHVPMRARSTRLARAVRAAAIVAGWTRGEPRLVTNYASDVLRARLAAHVHEWQPHVVQFEFHLLGGLLDAVHGAARIVVVHEPGHYAAAAATGTAARIDAWVWKRFERRIAREADVLVAFTDEDVERVRTWSPRRVARVPFGVDLPPPPARRSRDDAVLFFGNYSHGPNRRAAARLVESIFPRVRREIPEARLVLAGGPDDVELPSGPGVERLGYVDKIDSLLARAAVIAVPLDTGGGMRVKVVEALAAGKAVVGTSRALAGVRARPGVHFVAAETDDAFATEIVRLLRDPDAREALGAAARELAETTMSWSEVARRFESLYVEERADAGTVRTSGSVSRDARDTADE